MTSRPAIEPIPAVKGVIDLFARQPLVALGELHGCQDEADFVNALLHHPDFPSAVQVIVVEFGNARHQAVVDRFVAGEPVAARDLRPVWRDFFGWGFDAPIYEQFFRTVRAVNRTLPSERRLRVLLGDPPEDWTHTKLMNQADVDPIMAQRDAHYAGVVENHVLAPGRHGLLIAGQAHFDRLLPVTAGNTVQRLERKHPGSVHVIMMYVGFGRETGALEPYLADWPIPALVSMHDTWLGGLDLALFFDSLGPPPSEDQPPAEPPAFVRGRAWRSLFDSLLYLGPRSSLTKSTTNPAIYRGDDEYMSQLRRRESSSIYFGVEGLLTEGEARYFAD